MIIIYLEQCYFILKCALTLLIMPPILVFV